MTASAPLALDGLSLRLADAWNVAHHGGAAVSISDPAREKVRAARQLVDELLASDEVVYGITTGFGRLKNVTIPAEDARTLQVHLLRSHAVGVGEHAPAPVVRLLLLYRLNALLRGHSGIQESTLEVLLGMLQKDVLPVVPMQGSVGASGDLAPLAHLALVLIGEGEARVRGGPIVSGAEALRTVGLEPVALAAKEGLALINGTQFGLAVGTLALERAWSLAAQADIACALTIEALLGSASPFHQRVANLRPHPGHAEVGANVTRLLEGSKILESHANCDRVQDPYSMRCAPQVHGAARDALRHLTEVFEREVNAVTDNPLIFPEERMSVSAGNFHAEPLALPLDYAAMAVAELANISERRTENLVNPDLSHLPAFLAGGQPGLNSGMMMVQVTAAALVSENKVLTHPASVDSIPTSANQEDHVSMSPIAARQLSEVLGNAERVIAIEFLCNFLALHWRRPLESSPAIESVFEAIAAHVAPPGDDRPFGKDIDALTRLVRDGTLLAAAESQVARLARGPV